MTKKAQQTTSNAEPMTHTHVRVPSPGSPSEPVVTTEEIITPAPAAPPARESGKK